MVANINITAGSGPLPNRKMIARLLLVYLRKHAGWKSIRNYCLLEWDEVNSAWRQTPVTTFYGTTRRQTSEDSIIHRKPHENFKPYVQTRITLLKEKSGMEMTN
jgi:hypothetical protein